ncbi:MAG TPA: hypothetical protein VHZ26_07290 [Caulobacteraceae bacterium]|nr:hypothetical protein [Caulobacteraceae bacterium]
MPDAAGKLTPEELQKVKAWWPGRWVGDVVCPVCKSLDWHTSPYVISFTRFATDGLHGLPSFPHILVESPCGYSMFFDATTLGLFTPHQPPTTVSAPGAR